MINKNVSGKSLPDGLIIMIILGVIACGIFIGVKLHKNRNQYTLESYHSDYEKMIKKVNESKQEIKNESKQQTKMEPSDSSSLKIEAWFMAQEFLEDYLKSPSTANYGSFFKGTDQNPEKQVTYLGNNEYSVKGWVDSQNGFGATVRTDFIIKLRHNSNDSWSLLELPTMITR